eukprot:SAG31_NODE_948_length_10825_cov_9.412829_9_plen_53_part_00
MWSPVISMRSSRGPWPTLMTLLKRYARPCLQGDTFSISPVFLDESRISRLVP